MEFVMRSKRKNRWFFLTLLCCILFFGYSGVLQVHDTMFSNTTDTLEMNKETPVNNLKDYKSSTIDYSAQWNRTYGGPDSERLYDITECSDGGFAAVGYTESFAEDSMDNWVIRTNYDGDVLWTSTFGIQDNSDTGVAITECVNGDFVIAGASQAAVYYFATIDRINSEGEHLWSYSAGDNLSYNYFNDVIETSSGNIIAVGRTEGWGAGLFDILAVCLDQNGNPIWLRTYGGVVDDIGESVIECANGGYAILGSTMSYSIGAYDFWLLRLDEDGELLWDETYGGGNDDEGRSIIEYYNMGFVLVGSTESYGDPAGDFWVIRVNTYGDVVWDDRFDSGVQDFATDVVLSQLGGFTVTGIIDYSSGVDSVRVIHLDPDGTEVWDGFYNGGDVDYGYGIVEGNPGEYIVAGTTRSYGAGMFDAWMFLIPGPPIIISNYPEYQFEYGTYPYVELEVISTAEIDSWWLADTSIFNIVGGYYNQATIFTMIRPEPDMYELHVYVNNTAGYEYDEWFWIFVVDNIAPSWTETPVNQTLELGDDFQFQLYADDLSGIDHWSITGSSEFEIDSIGVITNSQYLQVGEYQLEISVYDTYSHVTRCYLTVTVVDTTAPIWTQEPEDQTIDYGDAFTYDLNATDLSGITWIVDDTSRFTVDWQGRIRNIIPLTIGDHGVTIHAADPYGNVLYGTFTITVLSSTVTTSAATVLNLATALILFIAGSVATIAIVTVFYILGKRRTPSK